MIWGIVGLLVLAFVMDLWHLYTYGYAQTQMERVITEEDSDYVELNGELISYNEEDQE